MDISMNRVFSRSSVLLLCGLVLALLLLVGCGAPRKVAIPPEWQTPPIPSTGSASQAPQVTAPPASLGTSQGTGAILKQTPSFREGNLPAGQEIKGPAPTPKKEPQAPQQLASMHLVDQAGTALSQGKPDAAIPLLEQAIQIDAYNGEAFLGLARAWRMKGSRNKAQEFSQKAEVLLQDRPAKLKEVYLFEADLFKELGDTKRMEQYRQKASKLQ
jgi:hypothetical protein